MSSEDGKGPATTVAPVKHDDDAKIQSGSSSSSLEATEGQIRSVEECAFDMTEDPRFYKPISTYEGIHRWDPHFDWTPEEEKRLIRKVRTHTNVQADLDRPIDG